MLTSIHIYPLKGGRGLDLGASLAFNYRCKAAALIRASVSGTAQ
jgi:hypothetical protein